MQFDAASLLKVRKPGVQPGFLTSLIFRSPLRFAAGKPFQRVAKQLHSI